MMITKVIAIAAIKADAYCTSKWVDGVEELKAIQAYQSKRKSEYPKIEEQLDKIYHSGIDAWKADIKAIKDKYPKP